MSGHWTGKASFIDGHLGAGGAVCVAMVHDELLVDRVSFTQVALLYQGAWLDGGSLNWDTVCVTRCQRPTPQYAIVGVQGQAHFVGGGDIHEERIADGNFVAADIGLVRSARSIDGVLYVCGMERQVFRRDGRNAWRYISSAIPTDDGVVGFESIDGFSSNEIYAVGWKGEIWQFDGNTWLPRDSGTNTVLVDVVCAADGVVYAVGRGRKLVVGRNSAWQVVDLGVPVELWSVAWFEGALYACSTRDIFKWNGSDFHPLVIDGDRPRTLQYLSVGEGGLCAIGPKDLFRFDGMAWTRID